jgi:hypothetical protein
MGISPKDKNEADRKAFQKMLNVTRAEADRQGTHSIESVAEEMGAIVVAAAAAASEPSLARIWNNPEDDVYNEL